MAVVFPVRLVSPRGEPVTASTPVELSELLYGFGYRLERAVEGVPGVAVAAPVRAPGQRVVDPVWSRAAAIEAAPEHVAAVSVSAPDPSGSGVSPSSRRRRRPAPRKDS